MGWKLTSARLAAALPALLAGRPAIGADAAHPTVVELFQSQGCSSCPPANANLTAVSGRSDILALSFAVTYWDRLGWKDTFASPAFTDRQWDYARRLRHANVFTPQVVVNGRVDGVGADPAAFRWLIAAGDRGLSGPAVSTRPGLATIAGGRANKLADVWLVRYDPRVLQVPIRSGENGGRTLPHRDIVRQLTRLGRWGGAPASFPVPPPRDPAWRSAILLQAGPGGPILAAARI